MTPDSLGDVIAALRASRRWSQTELAKRAGVSRNCIALIESGSERANSTISTLQKIFGAFGMGVKISMVRLENDK